MDSSIKKAQFIGRQLSPKQRHYHAQIKYIQQAEIQAKEAFIQSVNQTLEAFEQRKAELEDIYKFRLDRSASTDKPTVCVCQAFYGGDELDNFIDYTR